jgi:hypothetical protein
MSLFSSSTEITLPAWLCLHNQEPFPVSIKGTMEILPRTGLKGCRVLLPVLEIECGRSFLTSYLPVHFARDEHELQWKGH